MGHLLYLGFEQNFGIWCMGALYFYCLYSIFLFCWAGHNGLWWTLHWSHTQGGVQSWPDTLMLPQEIPLLFRSTRGCNERQSKHKPCTLDCTLLWFPSAWVQHDHAVLGAECETVTNISASRRGATLGRWLGKGEMVKSARWIQLVPLTLTLYIIWAGKLLTCIRKASAPEHKMKDSSAEHFHMIFDQRKMKAEHQEKFPEATMH